MQKFIRNPKGTQKKHHQHRRNTEGTPPTQKKYQRNTEGIVAVDTEESIAFSATLKKY